MDNNQAAMSKLFSSVYFTVIPSDDFKGDYIDKIKDDLEDHGATYCPLDTRSKLQNITHIIATHADFEAFHDASDAFLNVVKPTWVEQSILKKRLANTRQFNPDPALFLSSITLTCADDMPQGDKDAIIGGVLAMGGQYSPGMTKLVTHVVALTMDNPQCQLIIDKKLSCKAVLPHWIEDCLKLGKMINSRPYCLPHPTILDRSTYGQPIVFEGHNGPLLTAKTIAPEGQDTAVFAERSEDFRVFNNKIIHLDQELRITAHMRATLEGIIEAGGGSIADTERVEDADTLICQYRVGQYQHASPRSGRIVGNLNWLYHLIKTNKWTTPTNQLLHYPLPQKGLPEFKNFKISISNYSGDARTYLEHLIKAIGATFTKTLSQENTHLIAASLHGDKSEAAKDWGNHVVNHLWLEESYAECRLLSVANTRYITFPEKTNLGEVVGQTKIDRDVIEHKYFSHEFPTEEVPGSSHTDSEPEALSQIAPNRRPHPIASFDGKENETEAGREMKRKAKANALSKLHGLAGDIALFEKERHRVGGVVHGGRRRDDPDRINPNTPNSLTRISRKRNIDEAGDTEMPDGASSSEDIDSGSKKRHQKAKPTEQLRIICTGINANDDDDFRWDNEKADRLWSLGVRELDDVPDDLSFDVLVAPKLMKTRKWLCAMAKGPTIVTQQWLKAMLDAGKILPTKGFELRDPRTERRDRYRLNAALTRAKVNHERGGMLKGLLFYCTSGLKAGYDSYAAVLKINGAKSCLYQGRATKPPPPRNPSSSSSTDPSDPANSEQTNPDLPAHFLTRLYLVTSLEDRHLWKKFRSMAEDAGYRAAYVQPDYIQRLAVTQDITVPPDDFEWGFGDDVAAAADATPAKGNSATTK